METKDQLISTLKSIIVANNAAIDLAQLFISKGWYEEAKKVLDGIISLRNEQILEQA